MLNKSIRLTKDDAVGLQEIINHDPRVEKGQSEALYYVFKDAADNIPVWSEVAKVKFSNNSDVEIDQDYSSIRTFYIDENDFDTVVNSFYDQLNLKKVRISYMTRLCIAAARMKLKSEQTPEMCINIPFVEADRVRVDGIALIRKLAELLESNTEKSQEKILKIKYIMEE
jgi:hypothetical protein